VEVPAMTADIVERLHWDAAHQRSESETEKLEREAADEIERLRAKNHELASTIATRLLEKKPCVEIDRLRAALAEEIAVARETDDALAKADAEIERLRAVIVRAKDALLDGQSTQWVHDLLATVLYAQTKE
jgi:hypothetical protein